MKLALKKLAKLSAVDMKRATGTKRHHPLWNEEIHIEEELINLDESLATHRVAQETLKKYPSIHSHLLREQRDILNHCIGLVARMLKGDKLPREYSEADVTYALTRLTRLVVAEALRVGKEIDRDVLEVLKPFLSLRQRVELREWGSFRPKLYVQLAYHRLWSTYSLIRSTS